MADNARLFMLLSDPSGPIKGESRVVGREDWIELNDWNWELEPARNKDDAKAVRPSVLSFTKIMDRATTAMLTAMRKGTVLSASIRMEEDASLDMFDLNVQLDKVRVLSYDVSTQPGDTRLEVVETWTFDYDSLSLQYKPDAKSGTMAVQLTRPAGSSTESSHGKARKFEELSEDMSVQDLALIWQRMEEVRKNSPDVKKALEAKKAKGSLQASEGES
jgi:type VI protein secretion system component Hcp